jgi:alpha-galactosidase
MTPEELEFSKAAVQNYNRLKELIWNGDMYRLISPYEEERAVVMYVNGDQSKSVLFSYALHPRSMNRFTPVRLQGLDPNKSYKIEEINKMKGGRGSGMFGGGFSGKTYSGDYLMKVGISLPNNSELTSAVIEITEAK